MIGYCRTLHILHFHWQEDQALCRCQRSDDSSLFSYDALQCSRTCQSTVTMECTRDDTTTHKKALILLTLQCLYYTYSTVDVMSTSGFIKQNRRPAGTLVVDK